MADKPLIWVGRSLADLRGFPDDARQRAGYQLRRVQQGVLPDDWKPMPSVGAGVTGRVLQSCSGYGLDGNKEVA